MDATTAWNRESYESLARLGTATIHEAHGGGVVDVPFVQVVPGSRAAGPARIGLCGPGDNRAVHQVISEVQPGDVVVLSMAEPNTFGMVGELLARQAQLRGATAIVVNGGVRDTEQLRAMGLPIWAVHVRVRGTSKAAPGQLNVPVTIGGAVVSPGDLVVADADGVVVVGRSEIDRVTRAAMARQRYEEALRSRIERGESTYDIFGYGGPHTEP
jgi:4-hydroxy-4-methyl-2-oxoglutarate aldolase